MKMDYCEKEEAILTALRTGDVPEDLVAHLACCNLCTELMLVAQSLRQEVAPASSELQAPDPSLIWRRAQELNKKNALARATVPIRIAQICAGAAAMLALPWFVFEIENLRAWMPNLASPLWTMDRTLSDAFTGITLLGAVATLIVISFSSWYLLRQE